jgi:hypothetical protein
LVKKGKGKVIINWDDKKEQDEPDDEDDEVIY